MLRPVFRSSVTGENFKAHVVRQIQSTPPKIHNLLRLAQLAKLTVDSQQAETLKDFDFYQIKGLYPDHAMTVIDMNVTRKKLNGAREMLDWLRNKGTSKIGFNEP